MGTYAKAHKVLLSVPCMGVHEKAHKVLLSVPCMGVHAKAHKVLLSVPCMGAYDVFFFGVQGSGRFRSFFRRSFRQVQLVLSGRFR